LKNKDKIVKNIEDSSCSPQRKKLKVSNFLQIEDWTFLFQILFMF